MLRASDLLGLPVLDFCDRKLGTVREILVDLSRGRLAALVMPVKVLAEPDLVAVDNLRIGAEDVRLAEGDSVLGGEDAAKLRRGKLTLERVRQLSVQTLSGVHMGNVEDLVLDGTRIVALELSDGLIQDIFQGRETIALTGDVMVKEDLVLVPDGTKRLPLERSAGTWRHDQGF